MARRKGPDRGLLKTVLVTFLIFGYITVKAEKDFEFFGDDEDLAMADEGGSGDVHEGSGEGEYVTVAPPSGVPALFRATINVTSELYTNDIETAGRELFKLDITRRLQAALQSVFGKLPGTIRIRIVEYRSGSLLVTFDIDSDGKQSEADILKVLQDLVNSGILQDKNIPTNKFTVSPLGLEFKNIRDDFDCPVAVGPPPTSLPRATNSWANLMVNNAFPCDGYVVSWNYYRLFHGPVSFGVFRQTSSNEYTLIGKSDIPDGPLGLSSFTVRTPILARKGDFIGVYYQSETSQGVIAMTTSEDGVLPEYNLFQNYYVSMHNIEVDQPFVLSDFVSSENKASFAIQAEMSYDNVPVETPAPPTVCRDDQWRCNDGECVNKDYRCDQQVDCFDGSDEDNCPTWTCQPGEFQCPNTQQCLPSQFVCNRVDDCGDNSDEVNCVPAVVGINLVRESPETDRFLLTWIPSRDIVSYNIKHRVVSVLDGRLSSDGEFLFERPLSAFSEVTIGGNEQSYLLTGLKSGTYYQVQISAVNNYGASEAKTFIFRTAVGGPAPVVIDSFREGRESDRFLLSWLPPRENVASYLIRYRQVSVVDGRLTSEGHFIFERALSAFSDVELGGDQQTYLLTSLQPYTYYQAEIYAENSLGSSEPRTTIFRTASAGCRAGQWECADGGCINLSDYCNSLPDCDDESDERDCGRGIVCNEGQIACERSDGSSICVDQTVGCDCADGEFQCKRGGKCISDFRRCDRVTDCEDASDEEGCPEPDDCRITIVAQDPVRYGQCMQRVSEIFSKITTISDLCSVEARSAMQCFISYVQQCPQILSEGAAPQFGALAGFNMSTLFTPGGYDLFCQQFAGCPQGMWQCQDRQCIPDRMRCDGEPQCEDRSDEVNCRDCRADQFTCLDRNCVEGRMKCDGIPQCEDGSDEIDCGCGPDMFECRDGNCVKQMMKCDGIPQCEDGSDEFDCPTEPPNCPMSDFQCKTPELECIDNRLVCDGVSQCSDGSDEDGCPGCTRQQFMCKSDQSCIPSSSVCNGVIECRDRSDELNCVCNSTQFQCGDGICIDIRRRCDRRVDCQDQSDEIACPCQSGEFQCVNGDCIPDYQRCDGRPQCSDQSDERNCRRTCPQGYFQCGTGHCLREDRHCNGYPDCPDQSDERNCPLRCAGNELACVPDNRCLGPELLCNRVYDCSDGSDELDCPRCSDNEFECDSDGSCISRAGRCNGNRECADGSDEYGCPTLPPISVVVSPRNLRIRAGTQATLTCIANGLPAGAYVEWSRGARGLPIQSAVESGKLMIPVAKPMDSGDYTCRVIGVPGTFQDIATLSVEAVGPNPTPEPGTCGRDQAVCQNGQCIPREYRCDGEKDCEDGSDEPADCYTNVCEPNEFQCPSGQCVMKIWRCDGENDCEDGFDESECVERDPNADCGRDEFKCVSGEQCVPLAYQCDQEIDCLDRSDEIGCAAPVVTVPPIGEVEVELGGKFTIICEAVGVPTPLIVWRLNWGNIPTGERVITQSDNGRGQLTIMDVRYEDAGAYTCEAINNRGSIFAIPDAIVIVRRQKGPCNPPYFNSLALSADQCIRCFCFGQSIQCFSSSLQVSRIALANQLSLIRRGQDNEIVPVEQRYVDFKATTREYQVLDMNRALPQGSYYWSLPQEFLGDRLTSYGGEIKYTAYYEISGRRQQTTSYADVIISGNGITLFYRGRTVPSPGVPTSLSAALVESAWEKFEGPIRGDTPVSQYATRADLMTVLQNLDSVIIRASYDRGQVVTRLGGVFMTTAVDFPTEYGQAVLVEECTCPTGYTGLSCQNCAVGFTRVQTGPYLGQCVSCDCNGHSNDCDPYTGECLNCLHNTYGPKCQVCIDGYYGDARRGTPNDCQACPCPLTDRANQFTQSCFMDTDNQVTCANCPLGYEGRRCERCSTGYVGDPMTPGSSCIKQPDHRYCDLRGSLSSQPNPITQRCECKENVLGNRCDSCKPETFYLSNDYNLGCVRCFCMGVSNVCQSTSWNRAQVGSTFTREGEEADFRIIDILGDQHTDQRFLVNTGNRELIYRFGSQVPVGEDSVYFALPSKFTGNKLTAYGGSLRYTSTYTSRSSTALRKGEIQVVLIGNTITLVSRVSTDIPANRAQSFRLVMFEQYWQRLDGQPATREHLLMTLADLDHLLIRASYEEGQVDARLQDITLEIAEERQTRQDRAYAVEQCVCRVGHRGLSCEDCDTGYTRSGAGLYLGLCEPCRCNGHSNECDPETGVCRNCQHNTEGDNCDRCAVGYYGDATRGTRNDCQKCPCPLTDSPNQFSPSCILDTDNQVTCNACPAGHTGRRCETCLPGYSGNPLKVGDYCKIGPIDTCDCDSRGTVPNTQCVDRQCQCKPYTQGQRCGRCREGHFYLEASNPQGCLTCFCSGITNQCTSSNYYRDAIRPQFRGDGSHNFVLMNRRMNSIISDGFIVDAARNSITYNRFEGVQRERESLFFQLPPKFRGDQVSAYGGYLRFTLEFSARREGQLYRDVDVEIISGGQLLRLYYLFDPSLEEGKSHTYEILLRESSFNDLRSNTAPTRETLMNILSNVDGILIRATYHTNMASVTLRDVSMDTAVATPTNLGGAQMVEDCRCPEGYTGLSCERCDQGYLRVSERGSLGRCVRCNCNGHAQSCDPETGRCLECQHNTEGDRCERCSTGFYGDATSGTPNDCRACPCPLTTSPNQFSRTCFLADDNQVTCDRCPTGYTGRNCELCAPGYVGNPTEPRGSCRPSEVDLRPDVSVSPQRLDEQERSTAVFQCSVSGRGPFNIVWSRLDSRQLPDRASVSPRYDLTIRDLNRDDSGRYICTATNAYGVTRREVELVVIHGQTPLQVRVDQPRLEIDEGQTARFVCSIYSSSRTTTNIISWSRQGSVLPSKAIEQSGVLVIPNVEFSDGGVYVCTGSDMFTLAEATATLIVRKGDTDPPVVRIEPRFQTVDEGSQVRFVCIATGGSPTIEWHRGQREMNPDATISRDGVLIIPRARIEDEADYYCKATNEHGTTEVRTILYITRVTRPEITVIVRRTKEIVPVGSTAQLQCYIQDETGRITLFWSRANGLPPGSIQDNGLLTIPNVQPSYAGRYVCTATDSDTGRIGTAATILEVTAEPINIPASASVEPKKLTIPMGSTGTLRCQVTGTPLPTVKWVRSRADLAANHQVSGSILRIINATMADRGIYVCQAENGRSAQDWAVVEVERRMRPKVDIYPNMTQQVSVGGSALFQCRVMDGDPAPTVEWKRAGGLPLPSDKVEIMENGVIMFKRVTQQEQGSYICTATNDMGSASATVSLTVIGPPSITVSPSKVVRAIVGQRVTLECTGSGQPIPVVYWIEPKTSRRGDIPIEESPIPSGVRGSAVLDIAQVANEDQGYYKCVARNTGGQTEDTVQLIVTAEQPSVLSIDGPSTLAVVEGQSVELVCSAAGIRNARITWRRREGPLPPGHSVSNGVLTLPRFRSEYAGEYICSTVTQVSTYEASVIIIVTVAPRVTLSPQRITSRAGDTIQLRCTASGNGPFNIEWSKVEGQMNPAATERDGILEIRQVTAADAGRYRCVVQSSSGSNDGYAIVEVQVPPTITVGRRDVYAERGRTAELRCDVTGTPTPVVRWEKETGPLPPQHSIQNGVLTITNVQPEDAGRYICYATSSSGSARDYAVLNINDGTIERPDKAGVDTQVVDVGDRVTMECIVTGTPLPTITWSRDDGPLPKDAIVGDGILIIPQARIQDAGTYTCLAVNEVGSLSSKVILYVRAQPLISAPSEMTAALGGSVSLVCDTSGFPSPDITWYRKDGAMPDDYTIINGNLFITRVRPEDAGMYVCHAENQYGKTDTPVRLSVGDLVPHFDQDPNSYMAFQPLNDVYMDFDILLHLKPESSEGLVLYNGQFEDGGGDFVCFGLKEGYPEFRFDVGSGPAVIRGNNTLPLNEWHTIKLMRDRKQGSMVVNDETTYFGESPGYFQGLDLEQNMFLGSVPNYDNIPKLTSFREGFVGTIGDVQIKGVSMNLGAEALEIVGVTPADVCTGQTYCRNGATCVPANTRYGIRCVCPQGFYGPRCEERGERCYQGACGENGRCYDLVAGTGFRCVCPLGKTGTGCQQDISIITPAFNKTSFISYPAPQDALFTLKMYVEFKPKSLADGIILYNGNSEDGTGDFMALLQKDGYLEFRFDTGSGTAIIRSRNPLRLDEWTRVTASRKNREGSLIVNNEPPETGTSSGSTIGLNLKLPLYLGGIDPDHKVSEDAGASVGFVGCVAELEINGRKVDLIREALESYNVKDCQERRLCERQPCENDGICEDLPGPDYRCLCAAPFSGKNCDVEMNVCLTNNPCQAGAPCSITNTGYRCDCPLGHAGDNCERVISLTPKMKFEGDGFIEFSKDLLPHSQGQERQTVSMTIRTTQKNGLILWQGEGGGRPLQGGDFFSIGLKDGYVEFSYEMGSGAAVITSRSRVNDGQTHTISVERLGRDGSLIVDSNGAVSGQSRGFLQMLNADGNIFVGGVSMLEVMTDGKYSANFEGCIGDLVIHGKGPLQANDAVTGYNVQNCAP